jgi:outer membrane protein OmpA-like peptidoglycan-associated protein/outer membrane protein W
MLAKSSLRRLGAACALTLAVGIAPAAADHHEAPPKWEFGLFGGYHFTSDTNELGVADVDNPDAFDDSWGLGLRAGYAFMEYISAEGEVAFLPTDTRISNTDVMPIGWRVHALAHFLGHHSRFRPFAVAGIGALTSTSTDTAVLDNDTDGLVHAGLGFKLRLADRWGIRVDGRIMFPPSTSGDGPTTDFEIWAGVTWSFGKDAPPADRDGDGIPDSEDKCPDEPENMNGIEDEDGCPEEEPATDPDSDGDGIPDSRDQCPNEPEDKDGFEDEDGCPDADNDGDDIPDVQDQCRDDAEDKDGFQDADGCPDPDNDGDGIPDAQDQCPGEPETMNGFEDSDGCPDEVPAQVKQFTGTIKGIKFRTNSAEILAGSNRTLDAAVKVLQEFGTVRLEIQGHTDSQGDDAYNLKLSQDRADAVKAYLVGKGIDESRVVAKGYGETQPVADNNTAAGRQQNRRVDFKLIAGGAPPPAPGTQPGDGDGDAPDGDAPDGDAPEEPEPDSP